MLLYMLLCGKFVTNLWHLRVGIVAQSAVCCVQVGASRWLKFNKQVLFMNRKNVKPVIALMLLMLTLIFSGCSGKPMDMKASSLGKLTTFSAETLDGKTFTQDDMRPKISLCSISGRRNADLALKKCRIWRNLKNHCQTM